ncbi:type IV pilin protein [Acinetobacter pragensis]|uniref:type IV pilin protein n=1 Tax=Acinetobacter pragensis TaxID=1806892 RepID=UPI003340FB9F
MVINKNKGFTLIEVMIAVAIVAILAAIAYPLYSKYQISANRSDVQSELSRLAQRLQSYHLVNHSYSGATLNGIGGTADYPATGTAFYEISLDVDADNQGYLLTAEPNANSVQGENGLVCINQDTQKLWTQSSTCTPTAASNWDGK